MEIAEQRKIGESRAYWTHKVNAFPSPVSVIRMAQLIDVDKRLYEKARIVYRFMISWYHEDYGDALMSMRHVSQVMKQRAPEGATVLSRSAVQRAIIALMETGWVVRTFKGRGKGKGASRYVPVLNVLELAAQGSFPEPTHANGTVELTHAIGTVVSHAIGTVDAEPSHVNGTKTLLLDPVGDRKTSKGNSVSADTAAPGLSAAPDVAGFDCIWKAYGKHGNKAVSREAFAAIESPDIEHIAARAKAWLASAKPGQRRMPLEKWLAAEKYDEADRQVATVAKQPVKAAPKLKSRVVEIDHADIVTRGGDEVVVVHLIEPGTTDGVTEGVPAGTIEIVAESTNVSRQADGQKRLQRLADACGQSSFNAIDALDFMQFTLTGTGDFLPAPDNDNELKVAA